VVVDGASVTVVEPRDTEVDREAFGRMLQRVAEISGFEYDKFASDNLNITWDKRGHKWEGK
jgi:hypothetical protein